MRTASAKEVRESATHDAVVSTVSVMASPRLTWMPRVTKPAGPVGDWLSDCGGDQARSEEGGEEQVWGLDSVIDGVRESSARSREQAMNAKFEAQNSRQICNKYASVFEPFVVFIKLFFPTPKIPKADSRLPRRPGTRTRCSPHDGTHEHSCIATPAVE